MKIGVLALQGAFIEHIKALNDLHVDAIPIRLRSELNNLDGLIGRKNNGHFTAMWMG